MHRRTKIMLLMDPFIHKFVRFYPNVCRDIIQLKLYNIDKLIAMNLRHIAYKISAPIQNISHNYATSKYIAPFPKSIAKILLEVDQEILKKNLTIF